MAPATRSWLHVSASLVVFTLSLSTASVMMAQSTSSAAPPAAASSTPPSSSTTNTQSARRAAQRRRRALARQQPSQAAPAGTANVRVAPTAAQRTRDAQILAAQQAQSAETARENNAVTRQAVRDQQQQQAEPRIQDAPGPGSQPLAGDPAVQPAQPADPPRIQDAPGPAQTLPKAPPAPAPQP